MESKKVKTITAKQICLLSLCIFIAISSQGQKIWQERKGCLRVQGNVAPGYLFAQKSVSAYFVGDAELFMDDKASFIGEIWVSFATTEKNKAGLRANHAIFWGANYHFLKPGRWDPYIGFTPGVGLVRASYKSGEDIKFTPFSIAPLVGLSFGCNYYIGSIFHLFAKVQGVSGQMFSTLPVPKRLDELKFMCGLGWNLRMWKPKKHTQWVKAG